MKTYPPHPFAEIFPIVPQVVKDLAADIKERGLQTPIAIYDGKIIDGRHRQEACEIAGVKPRYEVYRGKDPLGFVLSANLHRRHLTDGQRAMIAAKIATLKPGGDRKSAGWDQDANLHLDRETTAKTLAVSPRSVATASKLLDESPALARQVAAGKMSLNAASEELTEKAAAKEPVIDKTGCPIPEELHELWERRGEVEEMSRTIAGIENRLLQIQKDKDELFIGLHFSDTVMTLQRVHQNLGNARLWAVCSTCQGRGRKKCAHCKGKGFLSKFAWDTGVPQEIKDIRAKAVAK